MEDSSKRLAEFVNQRAEMTQLNPVGFDSLSLDVFESLHIPYAAVAVVGELKDGVGHAIEGAKSSRLAQAGLLLGLGVVAHKVFQRGLEQDADETGREFGIDAEGNVTNEQATGFMALIRETLDSISGFFKDDDPETQRIIDLTPMPITIDSGLDPEGFKPPADARSNTVKRPFEIPVEVAQRSVRSAERTYESGDDKVSEVKDAVTYASKAVGIPESLLLAVANKESRMGRITNNTASSATGAFQLMPNTFREIQSQYSGQFPILNQGIGSTRAQAVAAAIYLKDAGRKHREFRGRNISATEAYLYYLMGHGGGKSFINSIESTPNRVAALDWQAAAAANPSVFYDVSSGRRPRSYKQIYEYLVAEVGTVAALFEQRLKETRTAVPVHPAPVPPVTTTGPVQRTPIADKPTPPVGEKAKVQPVPMKIALPDMNEPAAEQPKQTVEEPQPQGSSSSAPSSNPLPQSFIRGKQGMVFSTN